MNEFFRKLRWLARRRDKESELREELRFHLEQEAAENQEYAHRDLGNVALVMEDTRAAWGWMALEQLLQDLRYSVRMLRKTPGFTAAAVFSLALGIGANTAIFSLLNAVVLRSLPVQEPRQLVQFTYTLPVYEPTSSNWNSYFGYRQFERFQARASSLSGVFGGTSVGRVQVGFQGSSGIARADAYTANFFSVLGLTPQRGRFFSADEDRADALVAVISDRYWRDRFAANPAIAGSAVTVNRIPYTIVGIAPEDFTGITVGSGPDLWVPLRTLDTQKPDAKRWTEPFTSWMLIAGRLRPGVMRDQAQAELDITYRQEQAEQLAGSDLRGREQIRRIVRESHLVLRDAATGMASGLRAGYAMPLAMLMCLAGIVLLVSCASLANMMLVRASGRRREIAVRLALGAGRARVARQLLTESLLLASIGGVVALATAWWGSAALVRMISTGDAPSPLDVAPDWRMLAFTAGVSLVTGVLFGLAPAVRGTRVDPAADMKEGAAGARGSSRALDRVLIVVQVAFCVSLVMCAGLFSRTLGKLWNANVGYDRENLTMFSVDAGLAGYPADRAGAVYREILENLSALPDVRSASASVVRPLDDQFYLVDRVGQVDGRKASGSESIRVAWNDVSPGYFAAVSTPIVLGRDFRLSDDDAGQKVVIINESLAARAFPGINPVGHRVEDATVVGVVKDSHYNGVREQPRPVLYRPMFQDGGKQAFKWGFVSFEVRSGSMRASDARRVVESVDRNLPVFRVNTLRAQTEQSLLRERLLALLSGFFGALALLVSCVGLYGLMAYTVARRTAEIGIRMALGARRDHIAWLVLREAILLTLAGIAAGVPLALWAGRYAKSMLFEIRSSDPLTIVLAVATLFAVAALAGYVPTRRALRVDPMVALRYD